jgi:flagellar hook-associated protein 2
MSTTVTALDSTYIQIINNQIEIESQPLTNLTTQRDTINVQKGIYSDLSSLFSKLQSSTRAMISANAFYSFTPGRSVKVLASNNATVLSASAYSTAAPGTYSVSVSALAKADRVIGTKKSSMTGDLGLSGTFQLGGAGSVSAATTQTGTVEGFSASANLGSGQSELDSGAYSVETRFATDHWEYRLVDSVGTGVQLPSADADGWKTAPTSGGVVDTGRGLSINFGTSMQEYTKSSGAPSVTYTAGGRASISVSTTDSLSEIASAINNATYASGKEIQATVIDAQLVLTTKHTGAAYKISANDVSGTVLQSLGIVDAQGAFRNERVGSDARFTVNDMDEITRSSNTGITDVINGLTIDLASDAEGKTANLDVAADESNEKSVLNDFITNFNSMTAYLSDKLTTVKQADGTYKRGALAGDSSLFSLRVDLMRLVNADSVNTGTLRNLSEIGLTLNGSMKLTISDSSKLESALLSNKSNVTKLVDSIMSRLDKTLDRFTSTSGYLKTTQERLDLNMQNANTQITAMNQRLAKRREYLYNQYAQAQATLSELSATQSYITSVFGSSS